MVETVTHPLSETGGSKRFVEPCILVIFGATGDLTARKLLPAIYNLAREGQLSPSLLAWDLQEETRRTSNSARR